MPIHRTARAFSAFAVISGLLAVGLEVRGTQSVGRGNRIAPCDVISLDIRNMNDVTVDADPTRNMGIRIVDKLASDIRYLQVFETNCIIISFDI